MPPVSRHPCLLIKNLEKSCGKRYRASLTAHSAFVRRHGLVRFMEAQRERYTCPACGGVISLHDRECSECRKK